MNRRHILGVAIALAASLPALAQSTRPMTLIFPYTAGGSGDALARNLAEKMRASLNETVIVENRTGAGGMIGVVAVKNAPADGRTLLLTPIAPISIFPHVYPSMQYDPFKDLAPVSQIGTFDFSVAVNSDLPVKSVKELVAWLKANPSKGSFASPGAGTLPHFFGLQLGKGLGIDLNHVAFRGSAAAINDTIAGHVPILVTTTSDVVQQHKAGRLRVIATTDAARSEFLPDVPTLKEGGIDLVGTGWYALYAPAGTPKAEIDKLSKIVAEAMKSDDMKQKMATFGFTPTGTSADELERIQKADSDKWAPTIKASGFKPEQ